ncbi:MAG: ribosome maturation factor RimM, partial [Gammaproteobacteria bacterium]|nr:ribosome maturation factor RimM [Gammaproteobacteria bacterium]
MDSQQVLVGRISGLYGVKGWVKIFSFTEPRENILEYSPWQLSHGDE